MELKIRMSEKTFLSFSIQIHNPHPYHSAVEHTCKPDAGLANYLVEILLPTFLYKFYCKI